MDIFNNIDFGRLGNQFLYDPEQPMIFSSGIFMWLFTAFMLIYMLLHKRDTARIIFVTLFSYYFYYKSSGTYFVLLAVVTVSDWFIANGIHLTASKTKKKLLVALSLIIDLSLLGYFKYTNFLLGIFAGEGFEPLDIFLPVGISFFTFQSLSYTIDVYRGNLKPLDKLLDYAFYVSFFPQLVAGPIVRASDFVPQIRKPLEVDKDMIGRAIALIVAGVVKKAIISDYISVNFVERIFDNPGMYSGIENLLGVYGYTLQIYCDFSGYSDMAIGIALLLGFRFPDNFNSPYKSVSVTEFWRRWHISLSSWLRDYLYISLGGNRKGRIRTYINLVITMLLGGLWHGANWNFIFWGALHGIALACHKAFRALLGRDKHYQSRGIRKFLAGVVTFHFVAFCWIFFRNATWEDSWIMISQICTNFNAQIFPELLEGYAAVIGFIVVGYVLHFIPERIYQGYIRLVTAMPMILKAVLIIAVVYAVAQVKSEDIQPFIYFNF